MKAVTVEPDPELGVHVGAPAAWRFAVQISTTPTTSTSAAALAWARASLEAAALPMRTFLVVGWTLLLLDGRPRSDASHVLGWPIAHSTLETVVLQRHSRLGIHATLIFTVREHAIVFASAMAYTNRLGRIVWAVVAPIHRWTVRVLLTNAARVVAADSAG